MELQPESQDRPVAASLKATYRALLARGLEAGEAANLTAFLHGLPSAGFRWSLPEVEAIIAKEEARLLSEKGIVPTPEARQRMVDSFTLQYYYEGFYVAYRPTPQGPEVLAVGHEEIGQLLRGMDQGERLKIKVGQP